MWLSTRFKFREGDERWSQHLAFVGLPQLKEVRSLDASLSRCVDDADYPVASLAELPTVLEALPAVANEGQYHLLVVDTEEEELPSGRTASSASRAPACAGTRRPATSSPRSGSCRAAASRS